MANLAATYGEQGRWNEAEKLQVDVVEMSKRLLGAEHPDTLSSMASLATTYRQQGRWSEADAHPFAPLYLTPVSEIPCKAATTKPTEPRRSSRIKDILKPDLPKKAPAKPRAKKGTSKATKKGEEGAGNEPTAANQGKRRKTEEANGPQEGADNPSFKKVGRMLMISSPRLVSFVRLLAVNALLKHSYFNRPNPHRRPSRLPSPGLNLRQNPLQKPWLNRRQRPGSRHLRRCVIRPANILLCVDTRRQSRIRRASIRPFPFFSSLFSKFSCLPN
jgi:Tetratricopeptide repeat